MADHTYNQNNQTKLLDPPESQVSANTAWESVWAEAELYTYTLQCGAIGTSMDAKVTQATDSGGSDAKDVSGAAITQLLTADANTYVRLSVGPHALDIKNGFTHCRLEVTASGTCVWSVEGTKSALRKAPPLTADATLAEDVEVLYQA
jgi:hypothetical protein